MAVEQAGLDPTIIVASIGVLGVVSTALITSWTARRGAKAEAKRQRETAGFSQAFDLAKYIREEVAKGVDAATKSLREESDKQRTDINVMKTIVGSLYGRLARSRDAVRIDFHAWRTAWGKQDMPPPLSTAVREFLNEEQDVEYDTLTAAQIKDIIDPPTESGASHDEA